MDLRGTSATMRNIEGDIHAIKVYHTDAYKLAVQQGFEGTLNEWLASLKGAPGDPGKSAYQYAVDAGYVGTEEEFTKLMATDEVLEVEYGVTPIEEIVDAHNNGKAIVCKHGGLMLPLVQRDRNVATFSGIYNGNLHVIVNNDGEWRWTTDSYVKAVEVRNVDHDDTIPTERAVWQKIFEREEAIRTEVPLIANRVSTSSGYGFDKTYAEIKEAVAAGRTILLNNYDVLYAMSGSGPNYYKFIPFVTANTDVSKPGLKVTSSDVWSEVETGAEVMTEEKVKTLIEGNAPLLAKYAPKATDNTSYAEIRAAVDAKRTVFLNMSGTSLVYYKKDDNNVYFAPFGLSSTSQGEYGRLGVAMSSDGKITTFDTGYEVMTEEVVKTLIQENAPEGITEEEVIELVKENAPKGVTSYNELTDVPCGVSDTLTHCVTNDRFYDSTGFYVKVGEFVNPSEFIANGVTITRFPDGAGNQASATYNECESDINGFAYIVGTENVDAVYFVTAIAAELGEEINGKTFPKAGIYFYLEVESVTAEGSGIGVKTLDVKYINTTTEITEASTDEQIPTAKAVFDHVKNNAGGASEWSDLGESVTNLGDTLTWDGNTEGKHISGNFVRVSDNVIVAEDLSNGCSIKDNSGQTAEFTEVSVETVMDGVILIAECIMSVSELGADSNSIKPGTYFMDGRPMEVQIYVTSLTIPGYNFTESTIKPIPEKYLPDSVKGGGVSSWNDLTDKPFGEVPGDTLAWDENTDDRVHADVDGAMFVKVSDAVPTAADLSNGLTIDLSIPGGPVVNTLTIDGATAQSSMIADGFGFLDAIAIVPTDNYTTDPSVLGAALTFPEAGLYYMFAAGQMCVSSVTIPGYTGFTITKKIDPAYLPDPAKFGGLSVNMAQELTEEQQEQARSNIGAQGKNWTVVHDTTGRAINLFDYKHKRTFTLSEAEVITDTGEEFYALDCGYNSAALTDFLQFRYSLGTAYWMYSNFDMVETSVARADGITVPGLKTADANAELVCYLDMRTRDGALVYNTDRLFVKKEFADRKNIKYVVWNGDVVKGYGSTEPKAIFIRSTGREYRFKITVDDNGNLSATKVE